MHPVWRKLIPDLIRDFKDLVPYGQQLITAELSHAAPETTEQRLQWLKDRDCNAERSRTARRGVRGSLEPYKQLLYERTWVEQNNAEFYLTGTKNQCEDDEELPSTPNRTAVGP
ncbi:hypothetical protein M514_05592 [Trichuris suis]|uniref:Uncharacterized protein n=1 Tax=Trichuris suis TaxID=68888 RepID=A0A085NQV1_9BILA|nr:hypothetical protein M513_05592 [Trichuris suis]KFD71847.1 hypothetical protein M514_05592 [Trichuris suis]